MDTVCKKSDVTLRSELVLVINHLIVRSALNRKMNEEQLFMCPMRAKTVPSADEHLHRGAIFQFGNHSAAPGVLRSVYIGAISQKCQFFCHTMERQQFANELSQQVN